jgi:hypothetical protein
VRQALRRFAQALLESREYRGELTVAADGKSLRGVWEEGKPLALVHFFVHQAQLTLDQERATDHLAEVKATQGWMEEVAKQFPGLAVLTGDARLADRTLGAAILAQERDYFLKLGKNPPTLYQDVATVFEEPGEPELVVAEKGHSRLERREVRTSGELAG